MPRGGAVGEYYGGRLAVTDVVEALWELTHTVAQVNSKKKIKPREMPKGIQEQERKAKYAAVMAAKYKRKRGAHVEDRARKIEPQGAEPFDDESAGAS